ncbi:MAG: recombinase family protein [Paraclostridium sp.]
MIYGYARVSTKQQSYETQIKELKEYGCEKIFFEKVSGTVERYSRPEFSKMMDELRSGDRLVVVRLDRIGRSSADLFNIIQSLDTKGVSFLCLNNREFDTSTAGGRLFFGVLAIVAQYENELRKERQYVGIERAKENGVYQNRAKRQNKHIESIRHYHKDLGWSGYKIAKRLGISRTTACIIISKLSDEKI